MSIKIPFMRKETSSTLLTISAAIALLLTSPLILSNFLLQPAQAQATLTFRTPILANGTATQYDYSASITFDAQGDTFRSSDQLYATGTYKITDSSSGQVLYSGSVSRVQGCCLSNPSNGDKITLVAVQEGSSILIDTSCSTSANNQISVNAGDIGDFSGPVECSSSSQGGGNATTTTAQPSSLTGTTTQDDGDGDGDKDGDGILDANDNCPNLPHTRCYKEGDSALVVHNSNR